MSEQTRASVVQEIAWMLEGISADASPVDTISMDPAILRRWAGVLRIDPPNVTPDAPAESITTPRRKGRAA